MSSVTPATEPVARAAIIGLLRDRLPGLLAVYAFGSRISGGATPDSDLDLAVLVGGYLDAVERWKLAGELAELSGCPVDLVDLRAASTVMQFQIITNGVRLWAADVRAGLYETFILSEKTALDEARAALLAEIQERGRVYGR